MNKDCLHAHYSDGHCAEMICWNYVNKCPRHSTNGRKNEKCSRNDWRRDLMDRQIAQRKMWEGDRYYGPEE